MDHLLASSKSTVIDVGKRDGFDVGNVGDAVGEFDGINVGIVGKLVGEIVGDFVGGQKPLQKCIQFHCTSIFTELG